MKTYRVTGALPLDLHGTGETYTKGEEFKAEFNDYEESVLVSCGAVEVAKATDAKASGNKEG